MKKSRIVRPGTDTEEFAFKTMYSFPGGMVGSDKGATRKVTHVHPRVVTFLAKKKLKNT